MTVSMRPSYGPKIALLTLVLITVTGLAMNVDAILGPPAETAAPAETQAPAPTEEPIEGHGIDFVMEDHYTKVVLEQSTATLLADAVNELPPLPETWSREELQRDEGYVEDEDEAEYYSELDQLNSVLRTASPKERAALTALFEVKKSQPTPKAEVRPKAVVKPRSRLTLRPNAAVIKKRSKTSKPGTSRKPVAESKPATASAPVAPGKAATEAPKEASGPTVDPNASAKELITLGRRLLLSGDPSNAERAYRLALKKSSTSARARYGLAKALYQRNRVREAIGELGRILKGNQNHGSALLMMGSLLQERGQAGEARKYYQRYLDTHPNGRRADEIRSILARF